jgi:pectinesterase
MFSLRLSLRAFAGLLVASSAFLPARAESPAPRADAAERAPVIYLVGDSTMADKPKLEHPERGWGQLFRELVLPPATADNHAKNGRSTKSFIDEGRWDAITAKLQPDDWVIIQFGHNDEKADKPAVYAAPHAAYRDNLLRFIRETRERGAHPVLATSVARRRWNEAGTALVPTHGDYPAVIRALAVEQNVPLLDLEPLTTALEESFGVEGSKRLHLWFSAGSLPGVEKELKDDTHYSALGARRVADLAAAEIKRLGLPLARWIATPDVTVAADGTGDFTSLQEAISKAPMRTGAASPPWFIRVKSGTYRERIYVQRERGRMLIRGDDAATTTVAFDLDATQPGPDGRPIGTFATPTVQIDGDGMTWEDLTLANTAGPVGQALALRADGDRLVFRRCRFLGWQDTILVNRGRHYFEDCYIEGHVDFIFGGATTYFSRCHIHCLRDGYITAASTPEGTPNGYVFADCTVTTAPEVVKGVYLGRPWREFARTVFLRTHLLGNIRAEGWHNWNKPAAEQTTFYAEFASTGPGASDATRAPWAKVLTEATAAALTPTAVLSAPDAWNPLAQP